MKNIFLVLISIGVLACAKQTASVTPEVSEKPAPQEELDTSFSKLEKNVAEYKQRYGLHDPYTKLVDNKGNHYEDLYGVRNFRVVLHGVYYRGGANNAYNRNEVRDNENPLPTEGLENLCQEGFSNAIYLYTTNYSTAPKKMACKDFHNVEHEMPYLQISGLTTSNAEKFISLVHKRIKGEIDGPIYGHCWNGWHASGFVSALLLKQYCNFSGSQAVDYWNRNTDGNNVGSKYDEIRKKITDWVPLTKYKISPEESALICP